MCPRTAQVGRKVFSEEEIPMLIAVSTLRARTRRRPASAEALTSADRRTLGGVLGFLIGLAALGPLAGVAGAILGTLAARIADRR
jgi:uncharacterized membrane protein